MKSFLLVLFVNLCSVVSFAQYGSPDAILEEGKNLYKSEKASWYGTDIFLESFAHRKSFAGGYFSYSQPNVTKCVFFSRDTVPKIICTITFDSTLNIGSATIDSTIRPVTAEEFDYYTLRQTAIKAVNTDTIFKFYENTGVNTIPLISNGTKKVYILTGPKTNGTMILGNDYLLTFNKDNSLSNIKRLHKNIITINYSKNADEKITMHTHLPETGDFITPTDICTLMLYGRFTKWEQHYVMSDKQISIWNFKRNELVTLTKEAWDKMNGK